MTSSPEVQFRLSGRLMEPPGDQDDEAAPDGPPGPAAYETVHHPSHYGGDSVYETIKVIDAWFGPVFCLANVIKYVSRAGKKPGADKLDDLRKARWYLDHAIERIEQEGQA